MYCCSPRLSSLICGDLVTKLVPRDWRLHELETCVRRGFITHFIVSVRRQRLQYYYYDL
jgi:hypothetical protein